MGGKQSKTKSHDNSSSYNYGSYNRGPPPSYGSSSWNPPSYAPPPETYVQPEMKNKLQRRYSRIADNYNSLEQVTEALAQAGLESSNLIVGIDFTKSNEWTGGRFSDSKTEFYIYLPDNLGARSFNRRCLHHIGESPNPYEQAISIIGRTLSAFDEDNLIPCYGFGDASTHDQEVFSFYPDERPCNGFEEALSRYKEIVPLLRLAGPTSFAPVIESAISIVEQSGGQYHVLLIIADGQVTRSVDTESGHLSPQEQDTVNAIVKASEYALSIVLVGVGDGPWDMMHRFDDNIPARAFDNFQFLNFTEIMSKNIPMSKKETEFALAALMEIPSQYKATLDLQILGRGKGSGRVALPPPSGNYAPSYSSSKYSRSNSFEQTGAFYQSVSAPPENSSSNSQTCPICIWDNKNLAFGCGHQTCFECGKDLELCPICRSSISTRIRLY